MGFPARFQPGHSLQHQFVEPLRPAAVQRHTRRGKHAPQAAPVPVPPPDPGSLLRATTGAAVHVPEGNRPGAGLARLAAAKTRSGAEPGVMAFWCVGEYGLPV